MEIGIGAMVRILNPNSYVGCTGQITSKTNSLGSGLYIVRLDASWQCVYVIGKDMELLHKKVKLKKFSLWK